MKKSRVKRLRKLLKLWTKAEVMARQGSDFKTLSFIDYALREVELRNKIRKFLYGTSNLFELGVKWGLLKGDEGDKKKKVNGGGFF